VITTEGQHALLDEDPGARLCIASFSSQSRGGFYLVKDRFLEAPGSTFCVYYSQAPLTEKDTTLSARDSPTTHRKKRWE